MKGAKLPKGWGTAALEAGGALVLVLVLFSLFFAFLYALFPSGTPLKEMVGGSSEPLPGRLAGGRQVEATLSSLRHDVRFRRGDSIAWGGASQGLPLYSRDAVQTLDDSGAEISFAPKDRLYLGSNSLMVVTRTNAEEPESPRNYRVQVEGEVRGNLSAGRKMRVEVAAAGHVAAIAPGAARFVISPAGGGSQSLAVYAGSASIVTGGGVVRIPANYGIMLRQGRALGRPVRLPDAPRLTGEKSSYLYRLVPPKARFAWSAPAGRFHFQLADSPRFAAPLLDEKLICNGAPAGSRGTGAGAASAASEGGVTCRREDAGKAGAAQAAALRYPKGPSLSHTWNAGNLSKGSYYWRVSRIEEGREGAFSRAGECELVQKLGTPELKVDFPTHKVRPGLYLLSGRAGAGSRVFVDGVEIPLEQAGKFQHPLRLRAGVNLIRVEAFDAAGNASYASRVVYGDPDTPPPAVP
ncbi:hypothetical protein L4X63_09920 [Geomonas sp. Red32]|uniref:hypothetical protein n=1 Tax=Geomonas sp. Red32 TaxID=2912856 RepID=UPI00202CFE78|nr:hypothetical protein [Geomonas sp. Red32]MCM0081906.1 hypothetical protein [Geomonas sp. Red32]